MYKKVLITVLIIALGLVIQVIRYWPDENLHVIFCDVGQGDAILLKYQHWQMLIDTGPNEKVLDCLTQNIPFWDKNLEVVLVTHLHEDHYGGLSTVVANYQVTNLFLADASESESFKKLLNGLDTHHSSKTMLKTGFLGHKISFMPGGDLHFLSPNKTSIPISQMGFEQFSEATLSDAMPLIFNSDGVENERSIVLLLKLFEFEMLLMGDATTQNELALIGDGLIKKVEVLKVGHHGSKTSTGDDFLTTTQPEISVISAGLKNKFDHPSLEVLQALRKYRSQILRTDELGTVHLVTNGSLYWLL